MLVDAHVHIGSCAIDYPFVETRTDKIVDMLRAEGVDYAVVSSARALFYDCVEGNAEVLEACRRHPQLIPLVVVNPWFPEQAMDLLRNRREQGFVGVKLHPNLHNYGLDTRRAAPILEFLEREQVPTLTHSEGGDPLSGALALKAVAEKFPRLKLVAAHGGIFSDREVARVVADYPQLYLEVSVEYEAGKLEASLEMIGADRIMFGSDCPLHHPSVMLQRVRVMGLSAQDEEKILWQTACDCYGLNITEPGTGRRTDPA